MAVSFSTLPGASFAVLLTLALPRINEYMATAVVRVIYASEGAELKMGAKFLDLSIDIGAALEHDCPAISYFRIALRDRVWLRRLNVSRGDEIAVGSEIALFCTERDESLDEPPARAIRTTVAGILLQPDWSAECTP